MTNEKIKKEARKYLESREHEFDYARSKEEVVEAFARSVEINLKRQVGDQMEELIDSGFIECIFVDGKAMTRITAKGREERKSLRAQRDQEEKDSQ